MGKIEELCVDVECIVMGPLENNVYIVSNGQATIVVDPSCQAKRIVGELRGRKLDAIFVTHYHNDHTGALAELRQLTGATVYASVEDAALISDFTCTLKPESASGLAPSQPCQVDVELKDGDAIELGGMTWRFMLTPGHSQGSGCYYLASDDPDKLPVLLSGDTLFCGTTGRTDFHGGSDADMRASLEKLAKLPDGCVVLPGHMGATSIKREKDTTMRRWGVL